MVIRSCLTDGSFGARYPSICEDGTFVCGTDIRMFEDALRAEIPSLASVIDQNHSPYRQAALDVLEMPGIQPSTLDTLDLLEFCWRYVGKPMRIDHHSFFGHDHLAFDEEAGRDEFRDQIETIFRRNGVGYVLTEYGRIERMVPTVLQGTLVQAESNTGDMELDRLVGTAQRKYLDPNLETRREALEALWDAWERLKTLDGQGGKKAQTKTMLDKTAGKASPKFRAALENEAFELTSIGNSLRIRHSETNQEIIQKSEHIDYLFCRLFSLVHLILESR